MKEKIEILKEKLVAYYSQLSARERYIVIIGTLTLIIMFAYAFVVDPLNSFYAEQSEGIESANKNLKAIPFALARYDRLKVKRAEIEKLYASIEMAEGTVTHLESLIQSKAGITANNFNINTRVPTKFGTAYEQVPHNITFKIKMVDYKKLIEFLEELSQGKKPFIISSLSMQRLAYGDEIQVTLDVNSIRKQKART